MEVVVSSLCKLCKPCNESFQSVHGLVVYKLIKIIYEEVSDVLQEISFVYQNIYEYILQNKKEKDKIKFIIKNMNQGIIIVDENYNIEIINDYAKKVFSNTFS